jgi:soluble lytic murein transglycosylase-like protein
MRVPQLSSPEGLTRAQHRIAGIRARFQSIGGGFSETLARAEARPGAGVREALVAAARRHGVDDSLLLAVAEVESGLRPQAVSPKGAAGVMQLMPDTARALGISDPFDVEANVDAGARYLGGLLTQFGGDLPLALAAYNAGPGAVRRYGAVPPFRETRDFVARVLSRLGKGAG